MIHAFHTNDASRYGLIESVMLNNFRYWIGHNQANGKHLHDGRTWTYNSVKAFGALFPYLTSNQIRRCLESLVLQGVLIRGNYNESAYDKTSWFAFSDELLSRIDLADLPTQAGESAASHTNIKHTLKTKTTKARQCVLPDGFMPNKTAEAMASEMGLDIAAELSAFQDHHAANGSTFKDWQAAFRTWLRNAVRFARREVTSRPAFAASGETAYQRSMRERVAEVAPAIARKAPGTPPPMQAVEFFNTVKPAPALRIESNK